MRIAKDCFAGRTELKGLLYDRGSNAENVRESSIANANVLHHLSANFGRSSNEASLSFVSGEKNGWDSLEETAKKMAPGIDQDKDSDF